MSTDSRTQNLIINKLTKAQYEGIESPSETELYLTPDTSIQGVKVNGVELTPDAEGKVNIVGGGGASSFSDLSGSPYDNTNLANALNEKQDKLTAGTDLEIVEDSTIETHYEIPDPENAVIENGILTCNDPNQTVTLNPQTESINRMVYAFKLKDDENDTLSISYASWGPYKGIVIQYYAPNDGQNMYYYEPNGEDILLSSVEMNKLYYVVIDNLSEFYFTEDLENLGEAHQFTPITLEESDKFISLSGSAELHLDKSYYEDENGGKVYLWKQNTKPIINFTGGLTAGKNIEIVESGGEITENFTALGDGTISDEGIATGNSEELFSYEIQPNALSEINVIKFKYKNLDTNLFNIGAASTTSSKGFMFMSNGEPLEIPFKNVLTTMPNMSMQELGDLDANKFYYAIIEHINAEDYKFYITDNLDDWGTGYDTVIDTEDLRYIIQPNNSVDIDLANSYYEDENGNKTYLYEFSGSKKVINVVGGTLNDLVAGDNIEIERTHQESQQNFTNGIELDPDTTIYYEIVDGKAIPQTSFDGGLAGGMMYDRIPYKMNIRVYVDPDLEKNKIITVAMVTTSPQSGVMAVILADSWTIITFDESEQMNQYQDQCSSVDYIDIVIEQTSHKNYIVKLIIDGVETESYPFYLDAETIEDLGPLVDMPSGIAYNNLSSSENAYIDLVNSYYEDENGVKTPFYQEERDVTVISATGGGSASDMTGATASTDGAHGLAPQPLAGEQNKSLRGDGTWENNSVSRYWERPQTYTDINGNTYTGGIYIEPTYYNNELTVSSSNYPKLTVDNYSGTTTATTLYTGVGGYDRTTDIMEYRFIIPTFLDDASNGSYGILHTSSSKSYGQIDAYIVVSDSSKKLRINITNGSSSSYDITYEDDLVLNHIYTLQFNKSNILVDDSLVGTFSSSVNGSYFTYYGYGTTSTNCTYAKHIGIKYTRSDEVLYDIVPACPTTGTEAGLFDKISKRFIHSSNTNNPWHLVTSSSPYTDSNPRILTVNNSNEAVFNQMTKSQDEIYYVSRGETLDTIVNVPSATYTYSQLDSLNSRMLVADDNTITKNSNNEIQTVAVIDQHKNTRSFKCWYGSQSHYDALEETDMTTVYFVDEQALELNYLESTGAQFINLPFNFSPNTDEMYAEVTMLESLSEQKADKYFIAPTTWNSNNNRFTLGGFMLTINPNNYHFNCAFGNLATGQTYFNPRTNADNNKHIYTYANRIFTMVDLSLSYNATSSTWGGDTDNLKLFYGYNAPTKCRIYRIWHKRNGEYLYDLVPRLSLSVEGKPCMYDQANDVEYTNDGTDEFLYG